jgi:Flp pilus assembly protein TadG
VGDDAVDAVMMRRLPRAHQGAGIVEYALGLNILLLLTLGLTDLGRAVWISNSLSYLAREGARHGAIASRTTTDIQNYVISRARLPDLDGNNGPDITVVATRCNTTIGTNNVSLTRVTVSANFESVTGLIGGIWRNGPLQLNASSRTYVEGTFNNTLAGLGACP